MSTEPEMPNEPVSEPTAPSDTPEVDPDAAGVPEVDAADTSPVDKLTKPASNAPADPDGPDSSAN
jgi:hypothetical protein